MVISGWVGHGGSGEPGSGLLRAPSPGRHQGGGQGGRFWRGVTTMDGVQGGAVGLRGRGCVGRVAAPRECSGPQLGGMPDMAGRKVVCDLRQRADVGCGAARGRACRLPGEGVAGLSAAAGGSMARTGASNPHARIRAMISTSRQSIVRRKAIRSILACTKLVELRC